MGILISLVGLLARLSHVGNHGMVSRPNSFSHPLDAAPNLVDPILIALCVAALLLEVIVGNDLIQRLVGLILIVVQGFIHFLDVVPHPVANIVFHTFKLGIICFAERLYQHLQLGLIQTPDGFIFTDETLGQTPCVIEVIGER